MLFMHDYVSERTIEIRILTSFLPHSSITGLSPGSAAVSIVSPLAPGDPLKTKRAVPIKDK